MVTLSISIHLIFTLLLLKMIRILKVKALKLYLKLSIPYYMFPISLPFANMVIIANILGYVLILLR